MRAIHPPRFSTFLLTLLLAAFAPTGAQNTKDIAVQVTAQVTESPAAIILSWPAVAGTTGYTVFRKAPAGTAWGTAGRSN